MIGEQCSEIEETLRKNGSKREYQLVKDLATVNEKDFLFLRESYCNPRLLRKMPYRRTRDTELMDRMLL